MDEGKNLDSFARDCVTRALVAIQRKNPDISLYSWFKNYLEHLLETRNKFAIFFADSVLELRCPEIRPVIEKGFKGALKNNGMFTLSNVDDVYSGKWLSDSDMRDPIDHFKRENIQKLLKIYYPKEYKLEQVAKAVKRKTGRNDPCPCGSGKKYKKCCLDKVNI